MVVVGRVVAEGTAVAVVGGGWAVTAVGVRASVG